MEDVILEYMTGRKLPAYIRDRSRYASKIFMAAQAGHEAARQVARGLGIRLLLWENLPDEEKRRILLQAILLDKNRGARYASVKNIRADIAARICVMCASLGYAVPGF